MMEPVEGAVEAPVMMGQKPGVVGELVMVTGEEVGMAKDLTVMELMALEVELPRAEMVKPAVVEAMAEAEVRSRPAMTIEAGVATSSPRPSWRAQGECEYCKDKDHQPTGRLLHHFPPARHAGTSLPEIGLVKPQTPPTAPGIHLDGPVVPPHRPSAELSIHIGPGHHPVRTQVQGVLPALLRIQRDASSAPYGL